MNRLSIREHGVRETANSNRAASTRSAPTSLRGRCSDDASRPRIVADGPSTAPFAQCWHDQTSRSDRTKPNGCAARPTGAKVRAAAPATPVIRLAELLGRLSLAFDIANDAPYGKGVRSVVLASSWAVAPARPMASFTTRSGFRCSGI